MYAGAIEAYEHAIVFARPFRVRGVAIETQAVAFFTTKRVEQFVSVFIVIRHAVGHYCRSSLCFAPEKLRSSSSSSKRRSVLYVLRAIKIGFSFFTREQSRRIDLSSIETIIHGAEEEASMMLLFTRAFILGTTKALVLKRRLFARLKSDMFLFFRRDCSWNFEKKALLFEKKCLLFSKRTSVGLC